MGGNGRDFGGGGCGLVGWHVKTGATNGSAVGDGRWAVDVDREAAHFRSATGAVASMPLAGSRAGGTATVDDSSLTGFHGSTSVAFVGADGSCTGLVPGAVDAKSTRLAFELAEDGILVGKQVADQSVAVAFVHRQAALESRAENTGGESLCQRSDVVFVGRGQINQACEVGHNGIKRSNIHEAKLSKGALQNLDSAFLRGFVGSSRVDGFHDFVDL